METRAVKLTREQKRARHADISQLLSQADQSGLKRAKAGDRRRRLISSRRYRRLLQSLVAVDLYRFTNAVRRLRPSPLIEYESMSTTQPRRRPDGRDGHVAGPNRGKRLRLDCICFNFSPSYSMRLLRGGRRRHRSSHRAVVVIALGLFDVRSRCVGSRSQGAGSGAEPVM